MPVLADVIDAVVGGDTHRDTHALELAAPTGATISTLDISNDDAGFSRAVAWIGEHSPGPRVVVALEGTRSYGIGLARAIRTAGLTVVEIEVRAVPPDSRLVNHVIRKIYRSVPLVDGHRAEFPQLAALDALPRHFHVAWSDGPLVGGTSADGEGVSP